MEVLLLTRLRLVHTITNFNHNSSYNCFSNNFNTSCSYKMDNSYLNHHYE